MTLLQYIIPLTLDRRAFSIGFGIATGEFPFATFPPINSIKQCNLLLWSLAKHQGVVHRFLFALMRFVPIIKKIIYCSLNKINHNRLTGTDRGTLNARMHHYHRPISFKFLIVYWTIYTTKTSALSS